MDLRHLEQINAICREGSFSAAARKLGVTQPTLSRSIARLESQLRIRLFERAGGSVKPTLYGQFLADGASTLLLKSVKLRRDLEYLALKEGGSLRIGLGPAVNLRLMPQFLMSVSSRFPAIQLEIRQAEARPLITGLGEGDFDIVFCRSGETHDYSDLIHQEIFSDQDAFAVRPSHPALARQPLTASQLMEYPMASLGQVQDFAAWLGETTPDQARNATAFMSYDVPSIIERARKSDYVIRMPEFLLARELLSGELERLALVDWSARYECWMVTTAACWNSPVVKAIAQLAREVALNYAVERSESYASAG